MTESITPLAVQTLEGLVRQPLNAGTFSPLTGYPLVLLDLTDSRVVSTALAYREALCRLLPQLSCPVIALAAQDADPTILAAADVAVPALEQAQPLIDTIRAAPLAAATLVQLLRHNERVSLEDGLLAESFAYATLQGGSEFRDFLASRARPASAPEPQGPAVLVERDGDTMTLTLNRPEGRNAYSTAVRDALFEALQLLADDPSITRALIQGAGACFSVGGALDEFGVAPDPAQAHIIRSSRHVGRLIAGLSERIECRLHSACIGSGIELPAFATRVVARRDSFFQLPELSMGLIPGAGGTVSLPRRIGRQRTAWLVLSGKRIKAPMALEWGLVDALED